VFAVVDGLGEHPGTFALKRLKNVDRQERFTREIAALRRPSRSWALSVPPR